MKAKQSPASDSPTSSTSSSEPTRTKDELLQAALDVYMIPESKVLLLAMLIKGMHEASLTELQEIANAPLFEVSLGVDAMRTAKVNVNRSVNRVTLADEWKVSQ